MAVQDLKNQLEEILKAVEQKERQNQSIQYRIEIIEGEIKKLKEELAVEGIEVLDVNTALETYKKLVASIKEELDKYKDVK